MLSLILRFSCVVNLYQFSNFTELSNFIVNNYVTIRLIMIMMIRLSRKEKNSSLTFISLAFQIKLPLSVGCTMMFAEQNGTMRFGECPRDHI